MHIRNVATNHLSTETSLNTNPFCEWIVEYVGGPGESLLVFRNCSLLASVGAAGVDLQDA